MKPMKVPNLQGKMDLVAINAIAILVSPLIFLLPEGNIFRIVASIPLILLFPGYNLFRFFSLKGDIWFEMAIIPGLSIAVTIVCGLFILFLQIPYNIVSFILILLFVILLFGGLAILYSYPLPERTPIKVLSRLYFLVNKERKIFAMGVVAIFTFFISLFILQPGTGWTEMAVLTENGGTDNLMASLPQGSPYTIRILTVCHERENTEYTLSIFAGSGTEVIYVDSLADTFHFRDNTSYIYTFTLSPGERLEGFITFIPESQEIDGLHFHLITDKDYEYSLTYNFTVV